MSKYKTDISKETKAEAEKMANATQRPGQTKEQTKLIAQGIQKGIDHYKKQQKSKTREINKKLRSVRTKASTEPNGKENESDRPNQNTNNRFPWILLGVSWLLFIGYLILLDS